MEKTDRLASDLVAALSQVACLGLFHRILRILSGRLGLCGIFTCVAFVPAWANSPIKLLSETRVEDANSGDTSNVFKVAVMRKPDRIDRDWTEQTTAEIKVAFGEGTGKPFLSNKDGSIAAINYRPATKNQKVYLLMSPTEGSLLVVPDFNGRVEKLCDRSHKVVNGGEMWVERIDGNLLTVGSQDYMREHWLLTIRINPDLSMRLVKFSYTKNKPE